MTRPAPANAHSILPLACLEAMRSLDSPSDEEVAEYVNELLVKRLGLSDTVAAQISRYETAVRKDETVTAAELEQILRLVGRRTDAALVFADGGRRAARRALRRLSGVTRWLSQAMPGPIRRAIGFRGARSAASDVFGVVMTKHGREADVSLELDVAAKATPDGAACGFYAAGVGELLRQLVDYEGTLTHSACRARGDKRCEWRTSLTPERRS